MRYVDLLENLVQDVRYGVRSLLRAPGFTATVIATLALGIGGITAVFSVVHAVLLAPLPYATEGQLVRFYQEAPQDGSTRSYLSGAYLGEIRERTASFENVAALDNYTEAGFDLVQDGYAQRLRVLSVTSEYFSTLGASSLRGRPFSREEEIGGNLNLVVLSDALWRAAFGGDVSVIGRTIPLNAEPYLVIGVAPEDFEDPIVGAIDAWLPYDLASNTAVQNYSVSAIGRLRNGVTLAQAREELNLLSQELGERHPEVQLSELIVQPLKDDLVANSRGVLNILSVAVMLVLLVACVNVANLMLVRASGRIREFAVRSALGSGSVRIARQLLVESALLATFGALLGIILATSALRILRIVGQDAIPRLGEVGLHPVVLIVTAVVTIAVGFTFGIIPAARFAPIESSLALHLRSRSAAAAPSWGRFRMGLASAQFALALTLLVGAGGLLASFYRLQQIDLGFRVDHVLSFDLSLPAARYDAESRAAFQEELARRIETIPGVNYAGGTSRLPATERYHPWGVLMLTGPRAGTDFRMNPQHRTVSGHFFGALHIPLLAGRVFEAQDDIDAPSRAVVSESVARQAFPDMLLEDVLGQRFHVLVGGVEREIIGVVGDVAVDAHGTPEPAVYHAHRQFAANRNWALTQVVATEVPPEQVLAAVQAEVAALDPQLVIYRPAPLSEIVGKGVARERFVFILMGAFASVALLLAAIGLYGVIAYSVRERTQEIGIRMVFGATPMHIRNLVLRQAVVVVGIGVAAGIGSALATGRWLSFLLYDTSPSDLRVLLTTTLLLVTVALLATWLPARRASRVAPGIAMQGD